MTRIQSTCVLAFGLLALAIPSVQQARSQQNWYPPAGPASWEQIPPYPETRVGYAPQAGVKPPAEQDIPAAANGSGAPAADKQPDGAKQPDTEKKPNAGQEAPAADKKTPGDDKKPAADKKEPETDEPKSYEVGTDLALSAKVNNGGLYFETPNKDYRFHVGALIQQDYAGFSQDEGLKALPGAGEGPAGGVGDLQEAVFFRRGRIRFDGTAHELMEWDFDCELLANTDVAFDDMWVGLINLPLVGNLRAGHVKIPMGIESITSNRVFTFTERAALFDAFLPEYGPGFLAFDTYSDAKLTWAASLHRIDPTNNGTDFGDGQWNATGRLASLLYCSPDDRHYLHVGSAYSIRDDRDGTVRFRGRPEWRDTTTVAALNNRFIDTGNMAAEDYSLYQAEAAWVAGPFSTQSELLLADVNAAVGDPAFHGGYMMASYFLTGESRPYDKRLGRFGRLKPFENFFLTRTDSSEPRSMGPCGKGAWEIAARYSWVNLTSGGVRGGVMDGTTLGVNWYWNYNFRVQWNWVHTIRDADAPNSISGDSDAFIMRLSFDI